MYAFALLIWAPPVPVLLRFAIDRLSILAGKRRRRALPEVAQGFVATRPRSLLDAPFTTRILLPLTTSVAFHESS